MQVEVKYNLSMTSEGYWRFQAWVSQCGDDDDPNIFVHQLLPVLSNKDESNVIFVDIASRHDMEEYPADTPANGLSFFRKRFMDISVQDSLEMQGAVNLIERDIKLLTDTYEVIT
jgi:hypothetical protein